MRSHSWWAMVVAGVLLGCGGGDGGAADSAPPMDSMAGDALPGDAGDDGDAAEDGDVGDGAIAMDSGVPDADVDACAPNSCADLGLNCGTVDDGCGVALDCGACAAPESCGGAGVDNVCGCAPMTCADLGASCGSIDDGCGTALDCGTCAAPESCGGAGVDNVCGCAPMTCAARGLDCGSVGDGCGTTLDCGACAAPESCAGAGVANVCGCAPSTCADLSAECGAIDDGCGVALDCGSCAAPESCAGAGVANVCGCTPRTCADLSAECGTIDDGCGAPLDCGSCGIGMACGSGATANRCDCFSGGPIGPLSAGSGRDDASRGVGAWLGTGDILSENAGGGFIPSGVARVRLSGGTTSSHFLISGAHGFAIPDWAVIDGIEVEVRRRARDASAVLAVADDEVRLAKAGSAVGANRAIAGNWSNTWAYMTYGGANDLWGTTWTAAEVNDPGFGLALSTRWTGTAGNNDTFVDHIRITVHVSATTYGAQESAGGGANDASVGVGGWLGTGDIVTENAGGGFIPSGVARVRLSGGTLSSQRLVSRAHGFAIPSSATIEGIAVDVRRRARDSSGVLAVRDEALNIVRGGVISTAQNKAAAGNWPNTWTYVTYGGRADLWGLAWTPADINDPGFGAALRTAWSGSAGNNDTFVDHVRIRVFYTAPACP